MSRHSWLQNLRSALKPGPAQPQFVPGVEPGYSYSVATDPYLPETVTLAG